MAEIDSVGRSWPIPKACANGQVCRLENWRADWPSSEHGVQTLDHSLGSLRASLVHPMYIATYLLLLICLCKQGCFWVGVRMLLVI